MRTSTCIVDIELVVEDGSSTAFRDAVVSSWNVHIRAAQSDPVHAVFQNNPLTFLFFAYFDILSTHASSVGLPIYILEGLMSDSREKSRARPDPLKLPRLATRTQANDSERCLTIERPPDVDLEWTGDEGSAQTVKLPLALRRSKGPEYFVNASRKYRERKKADVKQLKMENTMLKKENDRLRLELAICREMPSDSNNAMLKEIHSLLRKQNYCIKRMMDTELWMHHSTNAQGSLTAVVPNYEEPVVGGAQSPSQNSFLDTGDIDANFSPEFLELLDKTTGLP
jgi:hypothetical protein